ncbi:MAG: UDP-N-acetylmuramoyl-L-alanyl-D-glutamate--2,6-diaminopimelate ligase, partial [Clostridia bacterium]|nr:UDP-N-acetylmuramoyl-L-alanyl-D-glutamate--2,6-diaminopimelate ligase [Clostridia bacterium]
MKLSLLLRDVNYTGSFQDGDVTDVTDNSNAVTAGSVFVCVKGAHSDGHDFAAGALAQGAAAVVVSRPLGLEREILVDNPREAYALMCKNLYGRACDELMLVGITGTNGKSTTSALLGELLVASGERVGAIGTLGNRVGDRVFPTALTTPGPHEMHRLFRMMVDEGIRICLVEATSQALD